MHFHGAGANPPVFCLQAAVTNARSGLEASQHQLQQEQATAAQLQQRLESVQQQALQVGVHDVCCRSELCC